MQGLIDQQVERFLVETQDLVLPQLVEEAQNTLTSPEQSLLILSEEQSTATEEELRLIIEDRREGNRLELEELGYEDIPVRIATPPTIRNCYGFSIDECTQLSPCTFLGPGGTPFFTIGRKESIEQPGLEHTFCKDIPSGITEVVGIRPPLTRREPLPSSFQ